MFLKSCFCCNFFFLFAVLGTRLLKPWRNIQWTKQYVAIHNLSTFAANAELKSFKKPNINSTIENKVGMEIRRNNRQTFSHRLLKHSLLTKIEVASALSEGVLVGSQSPEVLRSRGISRRMSRN